MYAAPAQPGLAQPGPASKYDGNWAHGFPSLQQAY
jgi:hypothetical protein